jgi:hypothetical protein
MKRITYSVVVDPDVNFSLQDFAIDVAICLADPNGWESKGYRFFQVRRNPQVMIRLTSRAGLRKVGCDETLSCAEVGGNEILINADNWKNGSARSGQDLNGYRQYVISHEMGHILGQGHAKCLAKGQLAPIMLQQTLGLRGCLPNTNV